MSAAIIGAMQHSLAIHRGSAFRASRGAALAAIVILHAGLLALALHQHFEPAKPYPVVVSISLLTARQPRISQPMPVEASPRLEVPTQAVWVPAELAWNSIEDPPASSITAVTESASPPSVPQPTEAAAGAPLQISQAQYLRAPVLRYPPAALSARREGSVGLRVLVGQDGRVIEVDVERSSGYAPFDEAACSAVRAALFKPYTVNGEPRLVLVRIPVDFTLKRRS
jgi:periplasmic protein TonB